MPRLSLALQVFRNKLVVGTGEIGGDVMTVRFLCFGLLLSILTSSVSAQRASAQSQVEDLLAAAARANAASDQDLVAVHCTRELLAEITLSYPSSDAAVAIMLGDTVAGIDVTAIEAQVGRIGVTVEPSPAPNADLSNLPDHELASAFAHAHPRAFVDLCKELTPALAGEVAAALMQTAADFGLGATIDTLWGDGIDAMARIARSQDLGLAGAEAIANQLFEGLAVGALDLYARTTGIEVESERIVELASPTAQLIVAAATSSGPAAPALMAGTVAFGEARGAALSSYAEDEKFALAARALLAADAYRRAAEDLRAAGRTDHAAEIDGLSLAVIEQGATDAQFAFEGKDGPVAAQLLRDMDAVVQLYRAGEEDTALARLREVQIAADEAAPGIFSLTFNNFYERFAMIGPQHRADSVRAYYALEDVLFEIFERAPLTLAGSDAAASEAGPGPWGPDIVWNDWPMPGSCPATGLRNCLAAAGVPNPALDFAFAVDPVNPGDVRAISFHELGEIDLVRLSVNYAPYEDMRLVNGSVGITQAEPTRNPVASFADATSQRILGATPGAYAMYPFVTAHRLLPDGTQRFVLSESILSGARASAASQGIAYSFLDFRAGDPVATRRSVGIRDMRDGGTIDKSPEAIRAVPVELQTALNARGYDAGEMDGYPGPQTRQALMEFQVEHCLSPTGQPTPETARALAHADGFNAPCAGQRLPAGIASNTPLLNGVYVDDLAFCSSNEVPYQTVHLRQRIVNGRMMTWGIEGGCETRRTDIREGVTLFRGTCYAGNQATESSWRLDVQSSDSFVDLDMFTALPQDSAPRRFMRCADNSALQLAFAPSSSATQETTEIGTQTPPPEQSDPVTFSRTMTLGWNGTPQGVVGSLGINGRLDDGGLSLSVKSVSGGHNPNAAANPVKSGAEIDFFLSAAPRKDCPGCTPTDGLFRSGATVRLRNDFLEGPFGNATVFVPRSVLERNDLVGVSLVGSNKIFLSDLVIDLRRDLKAPAPAAGPALSDAEETFRAAASQAFGAEAQITIETAHSTQDAAYLSARIVPAKPKAEASQMFGQVASTVVPVTPPPQASEEHLFEAILRREGVSWRVAQSRVDPLEGWWQPFCAGLEQHLGSTCSATVSAPAFRWPDPPETLSPEPAASGDAQLDAFLAESLPRWLVPADVDYRIFPKGDGGRISVAGTLILTEPTVEIAPGLPTLRMAARSSGLVNDNFLYQALADLFDRPQPDYTNEGHLQEYRVVVPAGTEISFDAELPYIETVREKKISGTLHYNAGAGEPLSSMPKHSYLPGDSRFAEVVKAAIPRAVEIQTRAAGKIDAMSRFAPGGLIFATPQGERTFEITFDGDMPALERLRQMRWSGGQPMAMSHPGVFSVNWTGRVDVLQTINYSKPLVAGQRLRGLLVFNFTKEGTTLSQSTLTLFVIRDGTTMAVADGLSWDKELSPDGVFVKRHLSSLGMAAWPK